MGEGMGWGEPREERAQSRDRSSWDHVLVPLDTIALEQGLPRCE